MICWGCQGDAQNVDFCQKCGRLQPASDSGASYFQILGVKPTLALDAGRLEENFHEKSRAFHPDRFQRKEPQELEISIERSVAVNEAYRTLKDIRSLATYVVSRYGENQTNVNEVPKGLAELYFDLQELVEEEDQNDRFSEFSTDLGRKKGELEAEVDRLSAEWRPEKRMVLGELQSVLHQLKYLESMQRDLQTRVEKEKGSR